MRSEDSTPTVETVRRPEENKKMGSQQPPEGFTDAQMRAVERMVSASLATFFNSNQFQTLSSAAFRQAAADQPPAAPVVTVGNRANSTEGVGLFWPDCAGDGLIITKGNETVFKDVSLFCD